MAIISSGIAFIDRNHHETTFGCINIFRWTIFHFVAVGKRSTTRNADTMKKNVAMERKDKRFINQLKL